jgi:hypothetical protein
VAGIRHGRQVLAQAHTVRERLGVVGLRQREVRDVRVPEAEEVPHRGAGSRRVVAGDHVVAVGRVVPPEHHDRHRRRDAFQPRLVDAGRDGDEAVHLTVDEGLEGAQPFAGSGFGGGDDELIRRAFERARGTADDA